MEKNANEILNDDLESLERKILLIGPSDSEKFKLFMNRLKDIQNKVLGMTKSEFDDVKFSIIRDITSLQFDFNNYMDGTNPNELENQALSGKAKIKRYKINLYKTIVADLKKLNEIDIQHVHLLRQKWNEDQKDEYLNYLPIEKSAVEEFISDAFLEYQIKHIQTQKNIPEEQISDYTSFEEYKARIKERLVKHSQNNNIDAQTKLDIEDCLQEDDLESLLKSKTLWKILSNTDVFYDPKAIDKMLGKEPDKAVTSDSNLPAVVKNHKPEKKYMVFTLRKKGLFGREKVKTKKILIKDNIAKLPDKYRKNVVSVNVPEGITSIEMYSFAGASQLEAVSLPSTLEIINKNAFENCTNLTTLNLPQSLEVIKENAFSNCEQLQNINIHSGIKRIEAFAFQNTAITSLDLSNNDALIDYYNSISLGKGAFKGCSNLKSVILPKSLRGLPEELFMDCTSLKDVVFPEDLTYLQDNAFRNCTSLTSVMNLPETVEEIRSHCFYNCTNLKEFKLPTFLKYLSPTCFDPYKKFDKFIMPKQLMNVQILNDLGLDNNTVVSVPNDAHGHLYEILRLTPGEQITYTELKLRLAEKEARETIIEPGYETYLKRDIHGHLRKKTRKKDPPEIVAINKPIGEDQGEGEQRTPIGDEPKVQNNSEEGFEIE